MSRLTRLAMCAVAAGAVANAACKDESKPPSPRVGEAPIATPAVDGGARIDDSVYRAELTAGRAFATEKKWSESVAAFQRALAARPGDARASSELGWSAFLAGDLDLASRANTEALAMAKTPRLQAASHYNLGRVAEANGETAEAVSHYRKSLQLREHQGVRERLQRVGARQCEGLDLGAWRDEAAALTDKATLCADARNEDPDIGECEVVERSDRVVSLSTELAAQEFTTTFVVVGERLLPIGFGTHSSGRGYSESLENIEERVIGDMLVLTLTVLHTDEARDSERRSTSAERVSVCVVDGTRVRCLKNDRVSEARLEVAASGEARFVSAPGADADPCLSRTFALWSP